MTVVFLARLSQVVVSQAPQHFISSKMQATYVGCFSRQTISGGSVSSCSTLISSEMQATCHGCFSTVYLLVHSLHCCMSWTRRSLSTCEDFFGWLSETRRPSSRVESNAKSCLIETGKSFSKMRSLLSMLGWNTLMSPRRKSPVWVRHGRDLFGDAKSCQTH